MRSTMWSPIWNQTVNLQLSASRRTRQAMPTAQLPRSTFAKPAHERFLYSRQVIKAPMRALTPIRRLLMAMASWLLVPLTKAAVSFPAL